MQAGSRSIELSAIDWTGSLSSSQDFGQSSCPSRPSTIPPSPIGQDPGLGPFDGESSSLHGPPTFTTPSNRGDGWSTASDTAAFTLTVTCPENHAPVLEQPVDVTTYEVRMRRALGRFVPHGDPIQYEALIPLPREDISGSDVVRSRYGDAGPTQSPAGERSSSLARSEVLHVTVVDMSTNLPAWKKTARPPHAGIRRSDTAEQTIRAAILKEPYRS